MSAWPDNFKSHMKANKIDQIAAFGHNPQMQLSNGNTNWFKNFIVWTRLNKTNENKIGRVTGHWRDWVKNMRKTHTHIKTHVTWTWPRHCGQKTKILNCQQNSWFKHFFFSKRCIKYQRYCSPWFFTFAKHSHTRWKRQDIAGQKKNLHINSNWMSCMTILQISKCNEMMKLKKKDRHQIFFH